MYRIFFIKFPELFVVSISRQGELVKSAHWEKKSPSEKVAEMKKKSKFGFSQTTQKKTGKVSAKCINFTDKCAGYAYFHNNLDFLKGYQCITCLYDKLYLVSDHRSPIFRTLSWGSWEKQCENYSTTKVASSTFKIYRSVFGWEEKKDKEAAAAAAAWTGSEFLRELKQEKSSWRENMKRAGGVEALAPAPPQAEAWRHSGNVIVMQSDSAWTVNIDSVGGSCRCCCCCRGISSNFTLAQAPFGGSSSSSSSSQYLVDKFLWRRKTRKYLIFLLKKSLRKTICVFFLLHWLHFEVVFRGTLEKDAPCSII